MDKKQLEKNVKENLNVLTHGEGRNNSYLAEIKLRKKQLKKKKAVKKPCEHIAKLVFTEGGSAFLVCSLCNCLLAKGQF